MKTLIILALLLILASGIFAVEASPAAKMPEPRFEYRPAFDVIGMYLENTMDSNAIMQLWTDFFKAYHKIPHKIKDGQYGITSMSADYNPETQTGYRYTVGVAVTSIKKVPNGMITHNVPAADYAVFEHHGLVSDIENTYNYIFGEWIPQSDYITTNHDVFEFYGKDFKHNSEKSVMEIWVPVQKKVERPTE